MHLKTIIDVFYKTQNIKDQKIFNIYITFEFPSIFIFQQFTQVTSNLELRYLPCMNLSNERVAELGNHERVMSFVWTSGKWYFNEITHHLIGISIAQKIYENLLETTRHIGNFSYPGLRKDQYYSRNDLQQLRMWNQAFKIIISLLKVTFRKIFQKELPVITTYYYLKQIDSNQRFLLFRK